MKRTTPTMASGTKSRPMYSHASQNLKVPAGRNSMHPIRMRPARKRARVIESNAVRERGLGFIRRSLGGHNLAAAPATPPNIYLHRTFLHKQTEWVIPLYHHYTISTNPEFPRLA
jgi:hypothetical protein